MFSTPLIFPAVDEYGRPVERSKEQHPYAYSPFVIWHRNATPGPGERAVYSDRLFQWDALKHDRLCQKHFGDKRQSWSGRTPQQIEAFLREYLEQPALELELVMEGCNWGNGFPVWIFHYRHG